MVLDLAFHSRHHWLMPRNIAPRFGIGEWYGHSFVHMSKNERIEFAHLAQTHSKETAPACPFLSTGQSIKQCTKKGGVCSLRLYESLGNGSATPVVGETGKLRVVCPERFKQSGTIYKEIGRTIIETETPQVVAEVRFLQRPASDEAGDDEQKNEDVGNIDIVLVNSDSIPLKWCALEIQAVYFSGEKMSDLFKHIENFEGNGIPFPDKTRRPDYRSSGPKRLMPQLQIKVPTLRRWGKKMALVVDVPWFRTNVIGVPTVSDISNGDIAWFLVDFDESTNPATLVVTGPELQTLERAVEGLTGGFPVTLAEFEAKIQEKLKRTGVK